MPKFWITYTERARKGHAPFRPNHMVPASEYELNGDWLTFTSDSPDGVRRQVLKVRNQDVARIEWIEDWEAEHRKSVESVAYRSASRLIPRKIDMSQEVADTGSHPHKGPDFTRMRRRGLTVLDEGLPPLPDKVEHSDAIPVSYWTTNTCGAVQFVFYFQSPDEGGFRPAEVTLQFGRDADGWYPVRSPLGWSANYEEGPIGSPGFMRHHGDKVIGASYTLTLTEDEIEPEDLAVVMSGRHAPYVKQIWLVQGDEIVKRTASGHFGSWTICTETLAPLRVEARDAAGELLGSVDGPRATFEG